jgi:hypothetical protein
MVPLAPIVRKSAVLLACALLAGLVLLNPGAARALDDDDLDDFGWILLRMQRESITSQEEQAREAGRIRRRAEIEQSRERQSAETQAYFESVLEASKAALRAPQGVYYRKPGFASAEPPTNAQALEIGGVGYLYDRGIFWRLPGPPYVVVVPPYGAVVDTLPAGASGIAGSRPPLSYFFGVFFQEKEGRFEVVKPLAGTMVAYLPDGYQSEPVKGAARFKFGPTLFKPVFVQGVLIYEVVEP